MFPVRQSFCLTSGKGNHKRDAETLGAIINQKQTRFLDGQGTGNGLNSIPKMRNIIAFLTREAWMLNMIVHFICPRSKQSEAVKFLILDFFSAAQRLLVKFNPFSFFEVIAMFFLKKVRRCVTSKPVQRLITTPGINRKLDVRATTKRTGFCLGVRVDKGFHIVFTLFLRYCDRLVTCLVFCFCPIHSIPKWRLIYYSFICMLISPFRLIFA